MTEWNFGLGIANQFSSEEIAFIVKTLNHKKAWGVPFSYTPIKKEARVLIYKLNNDEITALFPDHPSLQGLSVCDFSKHPIKIYFSKENWERIPPASQHTNLIKYRIYVVLHEFGHALGYHKHDKCGGFNQLASVMMQQSKSVFPCIPDPWVVKK